MRALGWLFAMAIAASMGVCVWAWFFSDRSDAEFIRDTSLICMLVFTIALGAVEHIGRKQNG